MNQAHQRKWYWPGIVLVALTAAAMLACLTLAVYFYLPKLVSDNLPTAQIQRLGFADFNGRISRVGMYQTVAGPFLFGHADRPAISVQSIVLDYSPSELRQKKIHCIRIRDVTINGAIGPHGLTLPGLDTSMLAKLTDTDRSSNDGPLSIQGMTVGKVEIRSAMIVLAWRKTIYRIPFEADLKPEGGDGMRLAVQVNLYPGDQRLRLSAPVDLKQRMVKVSLVGSDISLDRFADLFHLVPGLDLTGMLSFHAEARFQMDPFTISNANADIAWHRGRLAYAPVSITPEAKSGPAVLSVRSADLKTWQVSTADLRLHTPSPVVVKELTANVDLGKNPRTILGEADVVVLPFFKRCPWPVVLNNSVPLPVVFDVSQKASGDWAASLGTIAWVRNTPPDGIDMTIGGVGLQAGQPRFSLTASGDRLTGSARWQLDVSAMQAAAAGTTIGFPAVHGQGELQFNERKLGTGWSGHARIQIPEPTIDGNGLAGKLDDLVLSAHFQGQGDHVSISDGRLRLTNGRLQHGPSGLQLLGGRLDLPYRSYPMAGEDHGTFSVGRIVHNHHFMGKIRGQIRQKEDTYVFAATHSSDRFPKLTAAITGSVRSGGSPIPAVAFSVEIPPYELLAGNDLGDLVPAMKGVTLSGMLSAKGAASLSSKGLHGDLNFALNDGVMRIPEKQITVEGINTALHFPELPRIRSGSAQPFRFTRATFGSLVIEGGTFDLQMESEKTLFVEKGRLSWCGGRVDVQSLRVTAGKQDYQMSLYCQRLGLSQLLEQLGSVNARGTGTVNGRIPIVYSNGRIQIDDGFLFSTPGEAGQIQLSGTDMLTRGIPAGTPQFVQVQLAREALKDYAYVWAKLGMISEGEDLVLRLQFDGKPANPLPFVYKKEIGGFVRVEAGAQGSIFQGIALDVNLRLPLNQLLQYKGIVNMIE